ncbi:MAG: hypothetical protein GXP32_04100 [Kiritimatiellaeota bacterium]|nr:hypothetical protein [Kiritimatiellota bacterium]
MTLPNGKTMVERAQKDVSDIFELLDELDCQTDNINGETIEDTLNEK